MYPEAIVTKVQLLLHKRQGVLKSGMLAHNSGHFGVSSLLLLFVISGTRKNEKKSFVGASCRLTSFS
jgi:hypothetical protein